jgi:hypothetical protein
MVKKAQEVQQVTSPQTVSDRSAEQVFSFAPNSKTPTLLCQLCQDTAWLPGLPGGTFFNHSLIDDRRSSSILPSGSWAEEKRPPCLGSALLSQSLDSGSAQMWYTLAHLPTKCVSA